MLIRIPLNFAATCRHVFKTIKSLTKVNLCFEFRSRYVLRFGAKLGCKYSFKEEEEIKVKLQSNCYLNGYKCAP